MPDQVANQITTSAASAWGIDYLFYVAGPGAPIEYWSFKSGTGQDSRKLQLNGANINSPMGFAKACTNQDGNVRVYMFDTTNTTGLWKLREFCLDGTNSDWYEGGLSQAPNNFTTRIPGSILCPFGKPISVVYQSTSATALVRVYWDSGKWNGPVETNVILPTIS